MKIFFAIPLRSKQTATDWDIVCSRLKFTIDSIMKNSIPKGCFVNIIICGHEEPDFLSGKEYKDVNFMKSNKPIPTCSNEFMLDKGRKKKAVARCIDSKLDEGEEALFMFFDADDVINRYFIINVVRDFETSSYNDIVFMRGYVIDLSNNKFGFFNGENKKFYRVCGSSFISKIKGGKAFNYLNRLNNHTKFPLISEELGRVVKYSDFPGIAYIVNHGANDVSQRNGNTSIDNLFKHYSIDSKLHEKFIKDFGINIL